MLGRNMDRDLAGGAPRKIGYDPQTKFGAGVLYDDGVGFAYTHTPDAGVAQPLRADPRWPGWATLRASNKDSEHNIGNIPVRIVVAQLGKQTQPSNLRNLLSKQLLLSPGSQSLGGT